MLRLIFWRLVQLPFLLLVIYTITFLLVWVVPGDPLAVEGRRPPEEVVLAMKRQYNLDNPVRFYFSYLGEASGVNYLIGQSDRPFNFGSSMMYKDQTVNDILAGSMPISVQLGLTAILIATVIGVVLGVAGAVYRGGVLDWATLSVALIGISLPSFVVATVLLVLFALSWKVVAIGQWGGLGNLILPAVSLSLPFAAYIARLTRLGMLDVLNSDFIRTARAKGLSQRKVVLKHAMKVAFLPVLSYLGPATAMAMAGSFVVEQVFNVPGMGVHFVSAVQNKDIMLIIGVVVVFATMLILFNMLVDIAYAFVDPRIEVDG